ncbi:hypothetical protein G6F40_018002 [Rhizopus arrhizus]|nr:hypothetical protein G6F40_018002 [Rhizopus arrhizus]
MRPGHRSSRRPPPGGKGAAKPAWLTPTATPEPKPEPRPKPIWPAPGRASYPSWRPVDSRARSYRRSSGNGGSQDSLRMIQLS